MTHSANGNYRVGVIGCGRKGTHHARACHLHPMTEVVAVADTDSENLALACNRFDVPGYANHREMFEKEQIDIAVFVLPVGPNPEVVVECAEAKVKTILCDKPMSVSLEDADRMVEACRSRGINLAPCIRAAIDLPGRSSYASSLPVDPAQRLALHRKDR